MSTTNPPVRGGTQYRTYKTATAKLAIWLSQAVSSLGVNTRHQDGGYTITRFRSDIDLIVDASPKIVVPLEVVDLAKTAFLLRSERADLLQGTDVESDKRHRYVIDIIEEVYEKLNSLYQISKPASKPKDAASASRQDEGDNLTPSFQILELEPLEGEDCGGDGEDTIASASTTKLTKNQKDKQLKKKKKAREQAKQIYFRDEDEDPHFVLMCLLSDLQATRKYIKEVWQEYKEAKVDLVTASLTTNAVFDIIRTYEEDFPGISSLLSDWSQTTKLILTRQMEGCDQVLAMFFNPCTTLADLRLDDLRAIERSISKIPETVDLTFAVAFYFLSGPRHLIVQRGDKGMMDTIDEDVDLFGAYNSEQDRNQLDFAQLFLEDMQILANYAKYVYKWEDWSNYTVDHFTMQWKDEFAKTSNKTITLAQALGAQLYLDIQHVLRQDSTKGLADLYDASLLHLETIARWEEHMPFLQATLGDRVEANPKFRNARQAMLSLKGFAEDMLNLKKEIQERQEREEGLEPGAYLTDWTFLRSSPLLCGIILFQTLAWLRETGSSIAHNYQSIQFAGQLYYGCILQRSSGENKEVWGDDLVWQDMSHLFDLMGEEAIFYGPTPKTNEEMVQHYMDLSKENSKSGNCRCCVQDGHYGPVRTAPCLAKKGCEAVQYAKNLCKYEAIAVTHRIFFSKHQKVKHGKKGRTKEGEQINDWTLETLQALLQEKIEIQRIRDDFVVADKLNGKAKARKRKPTSSAIKSDDGEVSQVVLLRTLKEALHQESRALRFDLLSFHITCFRLLCSNKANIQCLFDSALPQGVVASAALTQIRVHFSPDKHNVLGSVLPKLYSNQDDTLFFNKGHFIIDSTIKEFFKSNEFAADEQVKRIDSVWGIAKS